MCLLQIGELAGGLSNELREETKERMQWGLIRGMRNWIAHSYNEMDDEIIWDTVSINIPLLLRFCNEIIEQENSKPQQILSNNDRAVAETEKTSVHEAIRDANK